jgi:hypothetical protein
MGAPGVQPGYLGYWPPAPYPVEPPHQVWSPGKTVLAIITAVVIACGTAVAVAAVDNGSSGNGGVGNGQFGNGQFGNGRGQFGGTGTGGFGQAGTTQGGGQGAANGLPSVGGN